MTLSRRDLLSGTVISAALLTQGQSIAAPLLAPQERYSQGRSATRRNAWLEVDTRQFQSNVRELQRRLGDLRKVCMVVKADAYGHGIDVLMPSIMQLGLQWLGVTGNDEARVIRDHGFRGRILRLRVATSDEVEDGIRHRIEEMIGGLEVAEHAARIANRRGSRLAVHVALNSMGMSREGLDLRLEANRADAKKLLALPGLRLAGVMDHCPVNTVVEHREGGRRFLADANWILEAAGVERSSVVLHCANSFGTLNVPENHFDLMRVGRVLYGHGGSDFPEFKFFTAFKSRVASVGRFPAGATVSYDRGYTLKRESRLANIPVGYSDGFRRVFSVTDRLPASAPKPHVLIHGKRAPIVGMVTMNVLVADVTDVDDNVRAGDEVVFYGRQGEESITLEELMGISGTNAPDLYTLWGNSLPKLRI